MAAMHAYYMNPNHPRTMLVHPHELDDMYFLEQQARRVRSDTRGIFLTAPQRHAEAAHRSAMSMLQKSMGRPAPAMFKVGVPPALFQGHGINDSYTHLEFEEEEPPAAFSFELP
eukprot:TRINITY_DN24527_c0_g1_i2.p1 TRINITY_DN24527_c0_g1~~TRINITY_DN24527_c0_g1_i2.p1  ORF type:complete len:114 (+),score=16.14 TRINITY_DN24527_c0_g1_i2:114-455(+)